MRAVEFTVEYGTGHAFEVLEFLKSNKISGTFWPNIEPAKFMVEINEDDLILLKLKVPLKIITKE